MPTPCKHLPADRGLPVLQGVAAPEGQPVHPGPERQIVKQRLLQDRRLRHAEAPERARDRAEAVHRAGLGVVGGMK